MNIEQMSFESCYHPKKDQMKDSIEFVNTGQATIIWHERCIISQVTVLLAFYLARYLIIILRANLMD